MIPTPGNRRATRFAEILEAPTRTDDPAQAPYLALATALRAAPTVSGPSPEFRTALRQRLVAVATVQGVGAAEPTAAKLRSAATTWRFQRRVAAVAGAAAAATAIAGVGVGASRSLPGDPFYGVKRATERVQLAATTGQEAKGKRHLEFARTRLHEVEALVGRNSALAGILPGGVAALGHLSDSAKTSTIVATLQDMDAETRAGAEDLLAVASESGSSEPLSALDTFTRRQFVDLRSTVPALPTPAQPRAEQSLSLLAVVADRTRQLSRATSGDTTPQSGGSGGPTGQPSTSPTPSRSGSGHGGHGGNRSGGSSTPSTPPSPGGLPTLPVQPPTQVPTIPSLPTLIPVPTELPTELPPLPGLSELPLLGN